MPGRTPLPCGQARGQRGQLKAGTGADRPGCRQVPSLQPAGHAVAQWERARRNGARSGTPYFTGPDGRPDPRINQFWREPGVRGRSEATIRRSAFSVKVWLNFLAACGVAWDQVGPECLAAFKDWRMSAEDNGAHVEAGSFRNDLTAIRRLYMWAGRTHHGIDNPVRVVVYGQTFWGEDKCRLEASPPAVRKADVKWLSPQAYRQWRNTRLRGFTAGGLPDDSWEGSATGRWLAAGSLDSHLGGARTLILPGRIGPATRESA
jgi:integrase family protein with SAM-like domain